MTPGTERKMISNIWEGEPEFFFFFFFFFGAVPATSRVDLFRKNRFQPRLLVVSHSNLRVYSISTEISAALRRGTPSLRIVPPVFGRIPSVLVIVHYSQVSAAEVLCLPLRHYILKCPHDQGTHGKNVGDLAPQTWDKRDP